MKSKDSKNSKTQKRWNVYNKHINNKKKVKIKH